MELSKDSLLHTFLAEHTSLRFIRFQWVDYSGVLRTRIVTKAHFLRLVENAEYLTVAPLVLLFPVSKLQPENVPATGSAMLQPDWTSLSMCSYATWPQDYASVMCYFYVRGLDDPRSLCPRSELNRTLLKAFDSFGKTFLVGFEIEFVILNNDLEPLRGSEMITTNSTMTGLRGKVLEALEKSIAVLESSGIVVLDAHTEGASQLEIATGPLALLNAIDALHYTHETIKTVFSRYDLMATMAPNAHPSAAKSGAHVHISLEETKDEESFLAGVLDRLATISAFGLANYESFRRVKDTMCATGAWVSWGEQHRDVPIRKIRKGHWELRYIDATANLYLVLASVISAGLEGIAASKPLTMHGLSDYASKLGASKLAEAGVREKLPTSMEEALERLRKASDTEILQSKPLMDAYLSVKEVDFAAMKDMSDEERRQLFVRTF